MDKPQEVSSVTIGEGFNYETPSAPYRVKIVTFYVGKHGPFIKQFSLVEYSPDKVLAAMQAEVDALKRIGAV